MWCGAVRGLEAPLRPSRLVVAALLGACSTPGPVVENAAPSASNIAPADGVFVRAGVPVTFVGTSADPDDRAGAQGTDTVAVILQESYAPTVAILEAVQVSRRFCADRAGWGCERLARAPRPAGRRAAPRSRRALT